MQESYLFTRRLENKKPVVFDWHIPEIGMRVAIHLDEFPQKPAPEIDEVHALIDQLATTRQFRIRAPLLIVTESTPVPVAGSQKHQRPERAGLDDASRLPKCSMIAVIEAHANTYSACFGERWQVLQFVGMPRRRFLNQYVLTCIYCRAGNLRERIVCRSNHHDIDAGTRNCSAPILESPSASNRTRETLSFLKLHIRTNKQGGTSQRLRTLLADEAAADDAHA